MRPNDGISILIIDDVPENLRLLTMILRQRGYQVHPVRESVQALEIAYSNPPDIILLDIKMPQLDGFQVCERFKADARTQDIPIIFISAIEDSAAKVRALTSGGVDYITKPIQAEEVLARVETHLALRDLRLHLEAQVARRTTELSEANTALRREVRRRQRHEAEKSKLLDVVRHQSEQLRAMTLELLESRQTHIQNLSYVLNDQVLDNFDVLASNLRRVYDCLQRVVDSAPQCRDVLSYVETSAEIIGQLQDVLAVFETDWHQDQPAFDTSLVTLSTREREVLHLIADGCTTSEIAQVLDLSMGTVYTYRSRIMQKLDIDSSRDLLKYAIAHRVNLQVLEEDF
jgi:DNA-binding response OmpR family regulator/DNA-binding CsgD family transcriptional regulator